MATITIKNIPDDVYERLKETAAVHRRSINSEVIHIIEQAVTPRRVDAEAILVRARELRETLNIYVTEEDLNRAKNEGRP